MATTAAKQAQASRELRVPDASRGHGPELAVLWQPFLDLQRAAGNRATADLLGRASAGQPLESQLRRDLERAYGVHLGDVRVHTDEGAALAADALGARAYTSGSDIVFARGEYAPATPSGELLVAHEVAHVLQQASATTRTEVVGASDGAAEGRARGAAARVTSGQPAGPVGDSGGAGVQREEASSPGGGMIK
jgi:Domain of unknown function (DUF4157)